MKPYFTMTAIALLLCSSPAIAAVYKCTGADGGVQFRDTPCDSDAHSLRRLDTPATAPDGDLSDERMEKTRRLLDAMREERRQKQEAAEAAKAEREQRVRRCNIARDRLRTLEHAGSLYDLDESGNRVYLSNAGREAEIEQAREDVRQWCD